MNKEERIQYVLDTIEDNIALNIALSLVEECDELQQENKQIKDNWNKLKEYCKTHYYGITTVGILDKMQKLEKGEKNK